MESRVAVIGIIVENPNAVSQLNDILHEYGEYIIGRMGIPTGIGASTSSVSPWMRRRTGSAPCPARSDGCPASPQKPPTPTMFSKTKVTL